MQEAVCPENQRQEFPQTQESLRDTEVSYQEQISLAQKFCVFGSNVRQFRKIDWNKIVKGILFQVKKFII